MTTSVLLEPGCCPAGTGAAAAVHRSGGKAVVVVPLRGPGSPGEDLLRDDGSVDADDWPWRVADVVGLDRHAVVAGCPVPLADAARTWARVGDEVGTGRWDVVVLPLAGARAEELLEGPDVLLRVLDARLHALAPSVGEDPWVAARVAALLRLRPDVVAIAGTAGAACALGTVAQHGRHGCTDPAVLGVPAVPGPGAPAQPCRGVRAEGDDLVWWLDLPAGADPLLHRQGDRLLVQVGGLERSFRLPAALTRCRATAARVVAHRLQVRFEPDPDAWR